MAPDVQPEEVTGPREIFLRGSLETVAALEDLNRRLVEPLNVSYKSELGPLRRTKYKQERSRSMGGKAPLDRTIAVSGIDLCPFS